MVVPLTADGFRSALKSLRSLQGMECVSFHTFTLPEDGYVRLPVKNVVRWELESLNIRLLRVTQLRSDVRDQAPAKDCLSTPNSLYEWYEGLKCRRCDHSPNSAACKCRWSRGSKRPIIMHELPALLIHAV